MEEWRPFPEFELDYEVSNQGRVRHARTKEIRANAKNESGMHMLSLWSRGQRHMRYVHIAVCAAFRGPPPFEGAKVLHWDDNHDNNTLDNLRWGTLRENQEDLKRNGKSTGHPGELNGLAKLTWSKVRKIRQLRKEGRRIGELATQFEVSSPCISNIIAERIWKEPPTTEIE